MQGKNFLLLKGKFLIERLMHRLLPLLCCWRFHLVTEALLSDCRLSYSDGSFCQAIIDAVALATQTKQVFSVSQLYRYGQEFSIL